MCPLHTRTHAGGVWRCVIMKLVMVVPTYWARASSVGWQEGDLIFDHPTPLDGPDTLCRFLRSLAVLGETDFSLALVVVPTSPEIEDEAVSRVGEIIRADLPAGSPSPRILAPSTLHKIGLRLASEADRYSAFLNLSGYAHVRNGCLLAARLMGADAAVLIDDDEMFEDPAFLEKVREGLGREHEGRKVTALAGYYLNPDGDYLLKKPLPDWGSRWPKYSVMDSAFMEFIGRPPRYKRTPFAFGGNLTLHSDLYSELPFDTRVTRGEDLDYLMMAKKSGVETILDNELSIKHLAPPKGHPQWQQMRQDVIRFSYQRSKIRAEGVGGLRKLHPEDLDPYPGFFLRDDLDERISDTCELLAEHYRVRGDEAGAVEALRNIEIAREADDPQALGFFLELAENWRALMGVVEESDFADLLENP